MNITYQGVDITNSVQIKKCIVHDTCGTRCDSITLEFENAAAWYSWGPQEDDEVSVSLNGYDSGTMYVAAAAPEDTRFKLIATALPVKARVKENQSYYGKTLAEIMESCAASSGMGYALFGVDGGVSVPYISREDESCAAFLSKLLLLEGASLKCVNGKYTAIDLVYAQDRYPLQSMGVSVNQPNVEYTREGTAYRTLALRSPYGNAIAEDTALDGSYRDLTYSGLPIRNDVQAGRWARGKLLHLNRMQEAVTLRTDFNPGFTALERIDITGGTDATGEWLIDDVEHDLIDLKSTATLRRCIRTIQ